MASPVSAGLSSYCERKVEIQKGSTGTRNDIGGRLCSRHSDLAMMVTEYLAFSTKNTETSTAGVRLRIWLAGFLARARGAFTSDQ